MHRIVKVESADLGAPVPVEQQHIMPSTGNDPRAIRAECHRMQPVNGFEAADLGALNRVEHPTAASASDDPSAIRTERHVSEVINVIEATYLSTRGSIKHVSGTTIASGDNPGTIRAECQAFYVVTVIGVDEPTLGRLDSAAYGHVSFDRLCDLQGFNSQDDRNLRRQSGRKLGGSG